jgi:hypothetical protein
MDNATREVSQVDVTPELVLAVVAESEARAEYLERKIATINVVIVVDSSDAVPIEGDLVNYVTMYLSKGYVGLHANLPFLCL